MSNSRNPTKDNHGMMHPTQREAEYANRCYEMMEYLTSEVNVELKDAEFLIAELIQNNPSGVVARSKFSTFIQLTNIHLNKAPGMV